MERTNTLTPGGSSVIKVGICAMNKKTSSRPMREILSRLKRFHLLEFIIFPDETVLHESIENWPIVDCLVSWYSTGFPLHKVIEYVNLRKPHLLNDLEIQYTLQDRRAVYRILQENGIDTPRYAVFERDENNKPLNGADEIEESDDAIIVNGTTFKKPFVEKPANAEDHDIYIYYPSAAGGGCQVLFRKIGNRSSIYSSRSKIRRDGSYIYEDFLRTDGTDVKIYTVGLEYAHAEARKSPALDGIVDRDLQGKEIRYPVILSAHEKMIARKVTKAFKQTVCGFDLLRANGQSLVCDVNGFSFVKTSSKYYDDCSQLLADCIARNLAPQHWKPAVHHLPQLIREESMSRLDEEYEEEDWELRSVVAIMRHGDRTPKQKMKMVVHHKLFFDFFQQYDGDVEGRLKLKKPKHLHEVLDIINRLIDNFDDPDLQPIDENQSKLKQMKNVLEMYGHFDGINRKVQIKAMHDKRNEGMFSKLHGRNEHTGPTETRSLLVIVKWGGELTPMGKNQAENLGKAFRRVYQAGEARFGRVPGCGLLRLHSTYRHDLKIYASDEGRVQMTAAAFAKGLLALEGELTPILVSLVKSDKNATKMLDSPGLTNPIMQRVKSRLHNFMRLSSDLTTEEIAQLAPGRHSSVTRALTNVHNPRKACETLYGLVVKLTQQITDLCEGDNQRMLYHKETLTLMKHRWEKLKKDFQNEDEFDISLIPDIYDCIKYDYLHNSDLGLKGLPELYKRSKALADVVIPQEYGITSEEKLRIAKELGGSFFSKIQSDLQHNVKELNEWTHRLDPRESRDVQNPHQHVRSRLYFTSESHVHAVINSLKHGILAQGLSNGQWTNAQRHLENTAELNYLTQIVFMQYENLHADPSSEDRFRIEVFFSPGVKTPINATVATQLQAQSLGNSKDYVVKKTVEDDLTLKTKAVNARQKDFAVKRSYSTNSVHDFQEAGSPRRLSLTYPSKLTEQNGFQSPSSTLEEAVDVRGAEIIETLPSLHPLVKLHSLLKQTHMDKLLNEMVSEESSTTMLESTGKNETEVASGLGYM